MQESILARLEASRKELLDLGQRNPLISYRRPKTRGLEIRGEQSDAVYDVLVRQGKAMSFVARREAENGEIEFSEPTADELRQTYTDTRLQTAEGEEALQHKLLNIYYAARTSIEEQGVNILYITLGMLQWYEAPSSAEPRVAPLVLVPVAIDRSSARERFRLRYTGEDPGHNLSLQAKLKAEFGIALPDLPPAEELSLSDYLTEVEEAIGSQSRWKVIPDGIELGFFSFGKFMIYHDLDSDEWPEEGKPAGNSILQSLFGEGFTDGAPTAGEEAFIDTETEAHELFQVVDADSSQVLAMLAVNEGKNLVIQGPPGTGKSQTITNIIANAVGQGKTVLFVAEKLAALEVVKRRLDSVNLGEACLELHSHKAAKRELHGELKRVMELGKPFLKKLQEEVALLEKLKAEVNDYCIAVNTPIGASGLTAHTLYGALLRIDEAVKDKTLPRIAIPDIGAWNAAKQKEAEAMAERVEERLKTISVPSRLPFWGASLKVLLPGEEERLHTLLQSTVVAVDQIRNETVRIAEAIGLDIPVNREGALQLAALVQMLSARPLLEELAISNRAWLLQKGDIEELLTAGSRLAQLKGDYEAVFLPGAWEAEVLSLRQELKEHSGKWWRFLIPSYNKAVKRVKSFCKGSLPKELETRINYLDVIMEAARLETFLKEADVFARELFGARWLGRKSDWPALREGAAWLHGIHRQVGEGTCPKEILHYLQRHEKPLVAQQYSNSLLQGLNEHGRTIAAVVEALQLNEGLKFGGGTLLQQSFAAQALLAEEWVANLKAIHLSIAWNNLVEVANEQGLRFLTDACTDWEEAAGHLKLALQKSWYYYLLEVAMTTWAPLRTFERSTHEEVIRQFRRLDLLNLQYNRAAAALKHWEGLPNPEAGGQVRVLKGEFNKKARHLPIRKLMQEAGEAIQAVKPVFMMSPLSIANYLAPGAVSFDLVIFDEASQVRPVEALGALLRGKQVVVVGDTKQLPPTSFFDTLNDNIDDEENVTADIQSILGMCDAQGAPQRMLRWHYRSRHESLIALSNHEFYEDRLVVAPSPGSKHRVGLVYHHLQDTVYDRGGTRTNPMEAEAVAGAVMEHARRSPQLSLGVVAFSTAQREAIQDALEVRRKAAPDTEPFFKAHEAEPFFVKNLENVQGDERDVIFISIGYGKTKEGFLSMSFGPLNNEGGERRLNVLITRAKQRCEVFTNITSADMDTTRSARRGVVALKSFLHYAQHGVLDVPQLTSRGADSPFEEMVARQLTSLGYTVRQQVGSKGFYLDLAIVDREHPGRYLLGIECDGAAYHSARSARDRDRLRQQVLEGIGWRIHRIWSTDWFRNPDRELKRVVEAIEKAKGAVHIEDETDEELSVTPGFVREVHDPGATDLPVYTFAELPDEIRFKELHGHSVGKLAGWIEAVARVEGPVHFDEVARRMVDAAGVTRVGSRIRGQLHLAARFAEGSNKIKIKGDFIWPAGMEEPAVRNREHFPSATKKMKFIAPEEVALAVEKVVREAIAIEPEDAVVMVSKLFGFARVTEEMRNDVMEVIEKCVEEDRLRLEGAVLRENVKM